MDEVKLRTILTLLLILVESSIFAEALEQYGKPHEYYLKKPGYSNPKLKEDGECKSDQLTCVPQDDCELECPYGFNKLRNGGACYFISNEEYNQKRTLHEAEDYCSKINSRLLWIEDSKELRELILFHKTQTLEETDNSNGTTETNSTIPSAEEETTDEPLPEGETPSTTESTMPSNMQMEPPLFFIGAEYDKTKGSWIWKETNDKIDWDILLYGTPNASESLKVIENININKCLVLNLTASGGLVQESDCIASNEFICKMGIARSRCSKTSTTKCCFSPSYDFHKQNREYGFANFNLKPGGCQMKIGNILLECEEVLSDIKNDLNETNHKYSVARIGSSYYYIANSTDDCIGREAIIQSEDVHTFVTSLFATRENYYADKNTKIGLTFMLEKRMAYWVNGKPDDFYEQFWLPGEPKRDDSVDGGCAAYSNVQGTATYLWRLFSKEMCETFDKVCELPLFKGSISNRFEAENKCGKRHERGVLAKSVHSIYSTDEANFGEFPWQAAVMYPEKYGREIQRKFACSGALIHKSFVLTSAHCVTSVNVQKDFVVVLGQHDLNGESYILEPVVMDVKEVILHQDFNVRQSSLDDLALLQLDGEVDVDAHPHIGIGCLPDPEEIRSHGGDWECFITGWSNDNKRHGHQSILLKRLEAEFTSEEYCRYINRDYYNLISKKKRYQSHKRHNYYRSEDSELLCTTSANNKCLEDQSPLLVCKKATAYVQKPFYDKRQKKYSYFNGAEKSENYPRGFASSNEIHRPGINSYKEWYDYKPDDSIVNSYGEERFDSDKWYIIGIGNTMSECRDENYNYYNENHKYDKYGKPKRSEYSYEEFINKGKPHFRNSYNDVSNDYLNKENKKSYEKEFPDYSKPKSYKTENQRKITRDYNYEFINRESEYSNGLKYKNRYDMAEVFTSVYDYINFIYYILDLYQ